DKRLGTRRPPRKTASNTVPAWGGAPPNSLRFTSAGRDGACRPCEKDLERRAVGRIGVLATASPHFFLDASLCLRRETSHCREDDALFEHEVLFESRRELRSHPSERGTQLRALRLGA